METFDTKEEMVEFFKNMERECSFEYVELSKRCDEALSLLKKAKEQNIGIHEARINYEGALEEVEEYERKYGEYFLEDC